MAVCTVCAKAGKRWPIYLDADGTCFDCTYTPPPVSADEAMVRAYLGIRDCESLAPSTFALMLEHAKADKKNGTIRGVSLATHTKVRKNRIFGQSAAQQKRVMRKVPVAVCAVLAKGMETMIENVVRPTVMPKRFAELGAYGITHEEEDEGIGSDSDCDGIVV